MRKTILVGFLILFLATPILCGDIFKSKVIEKVQLNTVAIAAYYFLDDTAYEDMSKLKARFPDLIVPLQDKMNEQGQRVRSIAFLGSGTLLKDNYIITVRHMFVQENGAKCDKIWCMFIGIDHPVEAEIVAITENKVFSDDYAVIRLKEDIGRPGLKIAKHNIKLGEPVIYTGSTGGLAFFTRYGFITYVNQYFRRDDAGLLRLSAFDEFSMLCVFPGAPGDSGGSIKNRDGEIVGIMYCGIENYGTQYIFANPLYMLKNFLQSNALWFLVE